MQHAMTPGGDLPPALRDLPDWWLGELDRALARGDFEGAAAAARELARLGVEVRYVRRGSIHAPEEDRHAPPR